MTFLFGKSRSTINEHILNAFTEGELEKNESVKKIGNSDFFKKPTNFYNLDVIISVGYLLRFNRSNAKNLVAKNFAMIVSPIDWRG